MHDDCLTFSDGRLKLSVDADGMAYVQTLTRIPLNHLRQVIVGMYSTLQRTRFDGAEAPAESCDITVDTCEE